MIVHLCRDLESAGGGPGLAETRRCPGTPGQSRASPRGPAAAPRNGYRSGPGGETLPAIWITPPGTGIIP